MENSFAGKASNLIQEWHSKNLITPDTISYSSHKKVWWMCKRGHEWIATIKSRSNGTGCPYCANKKVNSDNSLANVNPILANEWDFSKNVNITPVNVTSGSDKKIWWLCKNNHSWQAIIKDRNKGRGCPYCSGKRASENHNFLNSFPNLMNEWNKKNNIFASSLTPKSSKKVWWICKKGHEWQERVAARANGYGCPYCSNKRINNDNSLTNNSLLVAEWDYNKNKDLLPSQFTLNSKKRIWWICKKKHSWATTIRYRNNDGGGCPKCKTKSSIMELAIYAELKTIFKNIKHRAKINNFEIDIYLPNYNIAVEYDGSYWHRLKHDYDAQKHNNLLKNNIELIRIREFGLKIIGNHDLLIPKHKSYLDGKNLHLIVRSLLLKIISIRSEVLLDQCVKNYLEKGKINFDVKKIVSLLPEYKKSLSLKICNEVLSQQWHPTRNGELSPSDVHVNSKLPVWWKCENRHEWQENIYRRNKGSGCPYCSGHRVSIENCLSSKNKKLLKEWHPDKNFPLTPENVAANSNKKVWWICQQDHEWQAAITNRNHQGSGCPYCKGKKASPQNNLEKKFPEIAGEWHTDKNTVSASSFTHGSTFRVWWKCKKGHEWQASINQRTNKKTGCPVCKSIN